MSWWVSGAWKPTSRVWTPGGRQFEWLPGNQFLTLRWEVPMPEAPDGLAVMGWDEERKTLLQHYFDSRGVCRVYTMSFDGRTWEMSRNEGRLLAAAVLPALEGHGLRRPDRGDLGAHRRRRRVDEGLRPHLPARSSARLILPLAVLGSESANSTRRGYL